MSLDAYNWAWRVNVKPTMKIILLALADRADEKHRCFPSIDRLVSDTGLNRKTIMSSITKMVDMGLILKVKAKAENGQFLRNEYTLIGVKNRHEKDQNHVPETGHGPCPKTGQNHVPKTGHGPCPKNDQNHVPKTTKTMSQNRDTNLPVNLPLNLPIYINPELFGEFWNVTRVKKKAVNSDRAFQLILTELEKIKAMGQDPNESIAKSIRSGWSDVYPEKSNHVSKPSKEPSRDFSQTHYDPGFLGDD